MANKVKPTEKQRKAFELKMTNPDMPLGKAMQIAGYDKQTSEAPGENFLESRGVAVLREEYKNHLTTLGLGTHKIAEKMAEWLDAQKPIGAKILVAKDGTVIDADSQGAIEVPDYQTQLKAGEMLREDLGIKVKESGSGVAVHVNFNKHAEEERKEFE